MAAHLFYFLTLLFLIALFSNDALDYMCPGVIDGPQYYGKVHFEPKLGGRSGQDYAKMRFRIFYDESMDELPPAFKTWTQEAANFWSDALSVRPYDGTIFIERDCNDRTVFTYSSELKKYEERCSDQCAMITTCMGIHIPKDHLKECTYCLNNGTECHTTGERGKGIQNADMVLYVSGFQTGTCSDTMIAYGGPCNFDKNSDRPIVGGLNICPFVGLKQKKEGLVSTLKHEMMHALGFHSYMYNLFRDSNGKPLVERDQYGRPNFTSGQFGPNIVKTVERKWHVRNGTIDLNRTFIVTPNVVREARAQFNCSELEGAELEDYGLKGSAGNHWETRVYLDDTMKGGSHGEERVSRIDLALLEDTGWYKVNYSLAEPMKYGKDLGCDFCMKSCKYWMDKKRREGQSVLPFCDQTEEKSLNYWCKKTDKVYSVCPLRRKQDPVPMKYQYFDKLEGVKDEDLPFYSGISLLPDYCPLPITDAIHCNEEITPEETLSYIKDPLRNIALEGYGKDSFCFESRAKWTSKIHKDTCRQVETVGRRKILTCYKVLCMSGLLVVEVMNKRFPCFFKGQVLEISLFGSSGYATHEGSFVCPSCIAVCGQTSNFKCKPENRTLASEYPYFKDECIDGESIEKKIASLNKPSEESTTVTITTARTDTNESATLAPIPLIENLLIFVIIKIFI